jgi:alpha-1,3-mannosyltransferase
VAYLKQLKHIPIASGDAKYLKYYFAFNLQQCTQVLLLLLGSIVEAMRYLESDSCMLSVVTGRSTDSTFEVMKELRAEIEGLGSRYLFQSRIWFLTQMQQSN